MLLIENIITINKRFASGKIVNKRGLDLALSSPEKGWMDQVASLVKALVVGHAFEDGNKRTAAVIIAAYYTEFEISFDTREIYKIMVEIESKGIDDTDKIKELIKSVIR
ncbi:Fic family protein [Candidatus Woesearchaeota archaeon]|nr:Fic family protein [Candidatus Woesearchaeota archaeon]